MIIRRLLLGVVWVIVTFGSIMLGVGVGSSNGDWRIGAIVGLMFLAWGCIFAAQLSSMDSKSTAEHPKASDGVARTTDALHA